MRYRLHLSWFLLLLLLSLSHHDQITTATILTTNTVSTDITMIVAIVTIIAEFSLIRVLIWALE